MGNGKIDHEMENAKDLNTINGRLICSAHPLLVQIVQEGFDDVRGDIKDLEKKVDGVNEFIVVKKNSDRTWENWKNRIYGMVFVVAAALVLEVLRVILKGFFKL